MSRHVTTPRPWPLWVRVVTAPLVLPWLAMCRFTDWFDARGTYDADADPEPPLIGWSAMRWIAFWWITMCVLIFFVATAMRSASMH